MIIPDCSLISFWTVLMVSKHRNQRQCQIIPDYSHDFAYGPAVETQLSWLCLIIPNYSYYAHNPSRSNGHSLGNELRQKKSNRLQRSRRPLPFTISHRSAIPGWRWKGRVMICWLCLSALQLGIIGIIKIISIIEIISKILPEHQALGAALRDGWTPRAPLGSSLPAHEEIPIPDRYMPQANVSEADPQRQAMWNSGCSNKRRAKRRIPSGHPCRNGSVSSGRGIVKALSPRSLLSPAYESRRKQSQ